MMAPTILLHGHGPPPTCFIPLASLTGFGPLIKQSPHVIVKDEWRFPGARMYAADKRGPTVSPVKASFPVRLWSNAAGRRFFVCH